MLLWCHYYMYMNVHKVDERGPIGTLDHGLKPSSPRFSHGILTPGQPLPSLTLQRQAPGGRGTSRVPSHWYDSTYVPHAQFDTRIVRHTHSPTKYSQMHYPAKHKRSPTRYAEIQLYKVRTNSCTVLQNTHTVIHRPINKKD